MIATIGFFDGVHIGHCHLINMLKKVARERGVEACVITFDRHPRQVVQPEWCPEMLTTLEEKTQLLEATGIDRCEVLHFDRDMANQSAHDFMLHTLKEKLGVSILVTGYDNRFGHNRSEGFEDYVRYGKEIGIEVIKGEELTDGSNNVSSSSIRRMLKEGRIEDATRCLGREYQLTGTVVGGEHIGRTIGFPTANIRPDDSSKLIPANGVYAVDVWSQAGDINRERAMLNIGTRPTFNGTATTIEVHIPHFAGNLYGSTLSIAFLRKIREERKFDSPEALVEQLNKDLNNIEQ
ncbi:MAG: bifunctional riboflavin kinase/FAD synthetase [Prevotellaceae bacterium]|nr:bifunctional riboflavin kinase/FAD synthetase [Prevotellaceae bacterium]MDY5209761.1 bifunctional riboflavin kinase/FAD synthetase [Prevotella sp.]